MVSFTTPGGTTSYRYNGDGRRVKKTDGFGITTYVYNAMGHLAAEYFVPVPEVTQPPAEIGTRYVLQDPLGSTRANVDAIDPNEDRFFDHLPFGEDITQGVDGRDSHYPSSASLTVPENVSQRFSGKERDAETGLDYSGARLPD